MRKSKKAESSDAASSERRNWSNIFKSLVQMVRSQQNQLHSFASSHKFLEDRLRMQHEGWVSDVRLHKDLISQMNGILMFEEKKRSLEAAKADLALGLKQREAAVLKWILEHTEDELADFKAWFELLTCKSSNGEDQGTASEDTDLRRKGTMDRGKKSTWNTAEREKRSNEIKDELRRLRGEHEKLALEKYSEVSALLAEKKFVWNQYNIMENDYTDKLRTKEAEVEKANEKVKVLVSSMEQLQSENYEKDSKISELESKMAEMEAETKRLNKEISGLSVELESLRKFKNNQVTPILNHCTEGTKAPASGVVKSNRSRRNMTSNKEICTPDAPVPAKSSEKGTKSMKRKEAPVIPTSETPKLFTSSFKVPKLKSSVRVR
ncbi:calponin-likey domain-containing protein [Spatholobus suberectus]|nr:calponin-likey domain-containing protein [Spatholobus suberectus]